MPLPVQVFNLQVGLGGRARRVAVRSGAGLVGGAGGGRGGAQRDGRVPEAQGPGLRGGGHRGQAVSHLGTRQLSRKNSPQWGQVTKCGPEGMSWKVATSRCPVFLWVSLGYR